jgi:preprotein translocase subunit SecY
VGLGPILYAIPILIIVAIVYVVIAESSRKVGLELDELEPDKSVLDLVLIGSLIFFGGAIVLWIIDKIRLFP